MPKREVRFVIYILVLSALITIFFMSKQNQQPSDIVLVHTHTHGRGQSSNVTQTQRTKHLPNRIIKNVKRFVFFVGYARSGHSIVASLLDAHPKVVIAHEYSLFSKWPVLHANKTWLFNALYENSRHNSINGIRAKNAKRKGYSLIIPNWWQGKYDKNIQVIGDKAGGMTTIAYKKNHSLFNHTYQELKKMLKGVPISVIHVLRNPYDNIATMLLYNRKQRRLVNETHKYVADKELRNEITNYFSQVAAVKEMIRNMRLDVIELHSADVISDPKLTIRKMCLGLRIDCSDKYLHMCAQTVFPTESRSRYWVHWTEENIRTVAQNIQKYDSLKRYTY